MTKTFRQLLAETTEPTKVAPKKTATKKNTKPAAPKTVKKVVKESAGLTLADLGYVAPKKKLDEAAWLGAAPLPTYVDRGESKYDDSIFDLTADDIGLVFESTMDVEEDDEEPRDEQNSVDTMEDDEGDGVPKAGVASMANKADAEEGDEGDAEAGETASGKPTYQTVTFTVPALMHVLKVIAAKSPDKVTLNSMVMSMAHHCSTDGNTVDVEDLEEIKHKMHGMEFDGGEAGADDLDAGAETGSETPGPNPSIYATDDVIDDAGEAPEGEEEGDEGDEGETAAKPPVAAQKDAQDTTDDGEETEDGKTQLDDADDEEEKADDADDSEEEEKEEGADEGEDDEEDKVEEGNLADDIDMIYESAVKDSDIRMIRRRSGLKYWD